MCSSKRPPISKSSGVTLQKLREALPEECFEKSLVKSFAYLAFDLAILAVLYTYRLEIPYIIWVNLVGFMMWCIFVIGHDCGHTTFSNYTVVNDVVGHLCHAPLNVPYYAWRYSHYLHHKYHNHLEKDKSHYWQKEEEVGPKERITHAIMMFPPTRLVVYTVGYLLLGYPDGSHINPFGMLFKGNREEQVKCVVSLISVLGFDLGLWYLVSSWETVFWYYILPLGLFNNWLYMVTYLHHHHDQVKVYEDSSWSFLLGGLQTIDRRYGFGIDYLSHHITDGHLVHHLFFTKIPHYHLKRATEAVREVMGDNYKYKDSKDFLWESFRLQWFATSLTKVSDGSERMFKPLINEEELITKKDL